MCYLSLTYPCVGEGRFEEEKLKRQMVKIYKENGKKKNDEKILRHRIESTFTDVITLKANKGPRR